jgi:hypothetical protein
LRAFFIALIYSSNLKDALRDPSRRSLLRGGLTAAHGPSGRPRSATLIISKNEGDKIGLSLLEIRVLGRIKFPWQLGVHAL